MSPRSWLISGLLLIHLVAVAGAAIPPAYDGRTNPDEDIEAGAQVWSLLARAHASASRWSASWRRAGTAYTRRLALAQNWNMFANPGDYARYLRVRYHVAPGRVATELILPAHREDRVRLAKGVPDSFRDKAVSTALERFTSRSTRILEDAQRDDGLDPSRALARLARKPPTDLLPVVRYFSDRFARAHLGPGDRIVSQEIWYGLAPLPADADPRSERLEALRRYYAGPSLATAAPYGAAARYGATEREADIVWTLIYVHEP